MLIALKISTPFLPITSLQPQYFQAVTHSFVRRRSTIPPVFNNFRTLSVATGVVPLSCRSFGAITAAGSCSHCLAVLPVSAWSVSRTIVLFVRAAPTTERWHQGFLVKNNPECKILGTPAIPIQCCISPFNARKHRSEKGLEPYRQLR